MTTAATTDNRRIVLTTPYGIENRGIRYIAAVLRQHGWEPYIVLVKRWVNNSLEEPTETEVRLFVQRVREIDPLLVGFGFGAPYLKVVRHLTEALRQVSQVPVLWGGVHPTVMPEDCIPHADFVCIGEGEHATLELAEALAEGRSPEGVAGLWWHRGEEIVRNAPRPLLQELDQLPFPDYLQPGTCLVEDGRVTDGDPIVGTVEYRVYPTRGCPYKCSYCHAHVLRKVVQGTPGRFYRIRSVENVIQELELARRVLTIRRVKFDGDVFAFPKPWLAEFAREYKARISIPFELLTYPGELDEEDLRLLKDAGLRKLQTGIQSGSDRELLDAYGRRSKATDIVALSKVVNRLGLEVAFDLIFDNPLATEADKRSIVELLLKLEHPFSIYLYSLTLFPRTKLTEDLLAAGLVTEADVEGQATKCFKQFRLSFDWPRPREDLYWIALTILAAKQFVPRPLIRALLENEHLKRHPEPLVAVAKAADLAKVGTVALRMLVEGEMTLFKLRQYGSFKKVISQ